jgi:hypothetical protein
MASSKSPADFAAANGGVKWAAMYLPKLQRQIRTQRESVSPVEVLPTLSGAIAILSLHKAELRSAGVRHAAIFGSVARS